VSSKYLSFFMCASVLSIKFVLSCELWPTGSESASCAFWNERLSGKVSLGLQISLSQSDFQEKLIHLI
jgi:hypothetical protein